MLYGTLKQTNPAYQPKLWRKLDDLYVGGFQILERAKDYIPKQLGESDERYAERLSLASYINYLGMVVDAYASNLFAQEPIVSPSESTEKLDDFWALLSGNANLKGESFVRVLRCIFTQSILNARAFIACDFPVSDVVPNTRREEETLGNSRAYAFELPIEEMFDWEYADVVTRKVKLANGVEVDFSYGLLSWAILRREVTKRATPLDSRDTFVEEFRVWSLDVDSGFASWELYRTEPRKRTDAAPHDELDLQPVGKGTTSFKQIPILELCIPPGLWLGNKLGPIALEVFRRRSALHASEDRSLFPVPVVLLGPEVGEVGGELPSEAQQNPTRGDFKLQLEQKGFVVLGADDDLKYVEPLGTAQILVDKQISGTVDEFFRVAHMMAASITNTSSALGRSGTSKEQDHRAMAIVLEAYGAIVRDFAERIYDVIAEARGEDIDWKVHGLDKFDVIDRAAILDEAKSLSLVSIPSKTFKVHWQTKVALSLLGNVTPEMQSAIESEIARGVAAEEQMRDVMQENFDGSGATRDEARGGDRGAPPSAVGNGLRGQVPRRFGK